MLFTNAIGANGQNTSRLVLYLGDMGVTTPDGTIVVWDRDSSGMQESSHSAAGFAVWELSPSNLMVIAKTQINVPLAPVRVSNLSRPSLLSVDKLGNRQSRRPSRTAITLETLRFRVCAYLVRSILSGRHQMHMLAMRTTPCDRSRSRGTGTTPTNTAIQRDMTRSPAPRLGSATYGSQYRIRIPTTCADTVTSSLGTKGRRVFFGMDVAHGTVTSPTGITHRGRRPMADLPRGRPLEEKWKAATLLFAG